MRYRGQRLQSLLSAGNRLQLHLVAGIRGAQISITQAMYRSASSPGIRSLKMYRFDSYCWHTVTLFPSYVSLTAISRASL